MREKFNLGEVPVTHHNGGKAENSAGFSASYYQPGFSWEWTTPPYDSGTLQSKRFIMLAS